MTTMFPVSDTILEETYKVDRIGSSRRDILQITCGKKMFEFQKQRLLVYTFDNGVRITPYYNVRKYDSEGNTVSVLATGKKIHRRYDPDSGSMLKQQDRTRFFFQCKADQFGTVRSFLARQRPTQRVYINPRPIRYI